MAAYEIPKDENGKEFSMVQQALIELGESPYAPVIGSVSGASRPLWCTPTEKAIVDEIANNLFIEIARPVMGQTVLECVVQHLNDK